MNFLKRLFGSKKDHQELKDNQQKETPKQPIQSGGKKAFTEIKIEDRKEIFKEFNDLKDKIYKIACDNLVKNASDRMSGGAELNPIADLVKARLYAHSEAESKICSKFNIATDTLHAIYKECAS